MQHQTGTCPVCNGTLRRPAVEQPDYYRYFHGYDAATHTLPCINCGGQYMFSGPKGIVPLNSLGVPCTHEYQYRLAGRCYHEYICKHCGDKHYIDSGD